MLISTEQDIRLRGQSLQTRNDVLARQTERVKSACGLLLEGHYDDASWKGVFDESSALVSYVHVLVEDTLLKRFCSSNPTHCLVYGSASLTLPLN